MDFEIISFIIVGLISGCAAGFFGIGGGTIIVPTMLSLGMSLYHSIGISIMQMVFSSIFGSLMNYKKGLLNLKDGVFIGIGGLIGAAFSGVILSIFNEIIIGLLFLMLTIVSCYRFAFRIKPQINATPNFSLLYKNSVLILAGMLTGVFAISLGIGGGLLIAPILGYYLGFDSKKVVPLSLFFVIFSSVSGTLSLYHLGVIDSEVLRAGFCIGVSSIFGVMIGISLIHKASLKVHRIALLCIYTFTICVMAFELVKKIIVFCNK